MDLCVCVSMQLSWDSFYLMTMDFTVLLPACLDTPFLKDYLLLLAAGILASGSFWNLFQIPHPKAVSAVSVSQQTKYASGQTPLLYLLIVADSGSTASEIALGTISFCFFPAYHLHMSTSLQPLQTAHSLSLSHTHLTHRASAKYLYLDALQFFSHMKQQ